MAKQKEESKTTAMYKGPGMHRRILSRQDFVNAGVEESSLPEDFKELVWEPWQARRPQDISNLPSEVYDILDQDPAMEIKKDGEVVSEAVSDAAHVREDGSSPGVMGNPVLAEANGYTPPSDVGGSTDGSDPAGGSVASAVGGSTTGD